MAITTKNRAIHFQASLSEALFFIVPSTMVFLNPNKHFQTKSVTKFFNFLKFLKFSVLR